MQGISIEHLRFVKFQLCPATLSVIVFFAERLSRLIILLLSYHLEVQCCD